MSNTKKILPIEVNMTDSPEIAFARGIEVAKVYPTYKVCEIALLNDSEDGMLMFMYEGNQPTDNDILTILNYDDTYISYRSAFTEQLNESLKH